MKTNQIKRNSKVKVNGCWHKVTDIAGSKFGPIAWLTNLEDDNASTTWVYVKEL